jgi:hypothetical protein
MIRLLANIDLLFSEIFVVESKKPTKTLIKIIGVPVEILNAELSLKFVDAETP